MIAVGSYQVGFFCTLLSISPLTPQIAFVLLYALVVLSLNTLFRIIYTHYNYQSTKKNNISSMISQTDIITHTQNKSEYFSQWNEDSDVHPNELSGDQNATQSVLVASAIGDTSKANLCLTVTTIIKTVIGSGILSMPFTVAKMGWIFASLIFVGAAVLTQFGSLLLLKAKNMCRHSNYSTIFYQIWRGKISKGIGSIIIFVNGIGICIAELIIFKVSIRKILGDILGEKNEAMSQFFTSQVFLVLIMALLELPLTLVRKMEKLKFMALSGVAGIVLFMVSFAIFFIDCSIDEDPTKNPQGNMKAFPQDWFKACAAVPNVLLALSYQMNFFPIFKGMRKANDSRMAKAVLIGVVFCTFSYLMIGIMGYYYVGNNVSANFLNSLEYSKVAPAFFFIINAGFLLSIFFAFPIMFFGCRNNFIALIQLARLDKMQLKKEESGWRQGDEIQNISSYIQQGQAEVKKKKAKRYFILYTLLIYSVIVGVAVGVDDIQVVFNVIGAICSSSIGILLPCYFYFMLVIKKKRAKTLKYYVALTVFVIMAPYSIFSIVALYVNP